MLKKFSFTAFQEWLGLLAAVALMIELPMGWLEQPIVLAALAGQILLARHYRRRADRLSRAYQRNISFLDELLFISDDDGGDSSAPHPPGDHRAG